jgi:hypothetical protein
MMPAESIPYAGIAVLVGVTALEVSDMCAIVKDMDNLMGSLELEYEKPEGENMCLLWRDSLSETTSQVENGWANAKDTVEQTGGAAGTMLKKACRNYGICER